MSWLDQLQQASFRGVPFQVDSVDTMAGDNVVLREYPFQDLPQVFRMGEGAELIKLSAYVIGPDYLEQRDTLRQVLSGEGVLVHPTSGAVRVFVADRYRMAEAPTREGGVVRFDLTFARAEPRTYPGSYPSTQAQADDTADQAQDAAQDQFQAEFDLSDSPTWVQANVVDRITDLVGGVWEQVSQVTNTVNGVSAAVLDNYESLRDGMGDLVKSPAALAGSVRGLFELPQALSSALRNDFQKAFESVFGLGAKLGNKGFEQVIPATDTTPLMYGMSNAEDLGLDTDARKRLDQLNDSVDRMVDAMALAAWLKCIAADDLSGYQDVHRQRALLFARGQDLLKRGSTAAVPRKLPTMDWHQSIQAMLSAGLRDLQVRGRDQLRLTSYTPQVTMSIWQVSYLAYGTARWADEIQLMNPHIVHPMLVPAGKPLRLVSHD